MTEGHAPTWSVTLAIWLGLVGASGTSLAVLWGLSWSGAEGAVTTATADHLASEAGLVATSLEGVPVDVLARLGAGHASDAVGRQLDGLLRASGLHDAAVIAPDGTVLGSDGTWLPAAAEGDLIARAAAGERVVGALYRGESGALYLTGYAPLPENPGYVVAVEASATLGAVDELARDQAVASLALLAVVGLVAAALAAFLARPLRDLESSLGAIAPGDPPERLAVKGPREVWRVSVAARRLLSAVRDRDVAVERAHREQVDQLSRLAAEVAHEVRNPLNAVSLSIDRLQRADDPARRAAIASRLRDQVAELDAIASRLVDLARPLEVAREPVEVAELARTLAGELEIELTLELPPALVTVDRSLATSILRNLLLNARQAGARVVVVRGTTDFVEVEDDGPGLDDPSAVFAWFHTTRAAGSGLGLPTARRMAEVMGGTLVCRSGRPAVFRWTFSGGSP